jgi:hypothetical protein
VVPELVSGLPVAVRAPKGLLLANVIEGVRDLDGAALAPPTSAVTTCPACWQYSFKPRSSGANSGTSFVFGPVRRSASTIPVPWVTTASRCGMIPSHDQAR